MHLLLMDVLRRRKWFLIASFFFAFASSTTSSTGVGLGLGIGAIFYFTFNTRELFYLPISRKELWRTRWIFAQIPIVISILIRPVGIGIMMAVSHKNGEKQAWFPPAGVFQMIYLGSLFATSIPISHYWPKLTSKVMRILEICILVLGPIVLPVLIAYELPQHWHELSGGAAVLLTVGAGLSALSFFHSPRIHPRMVFAGEQPRTSSSSINLNLKSAYMRTGSTGLKLLMWRKVRGVVFFNFVLTLLGPLVQLLILLWGRAAPQVPWAEHMTMLSDPTPVGALFAFAIALFSAILWIAFAPDFLGLRSLRALPVSTRSLAAMFTLIPALFWFTFWAFPLVTYWILAGHLPPSLQLNVFSGLAALTCLGTSVALNSWIKGPVKSLFVCLLSGLVLGTVFTALPESNSTFAPLVAVFGLAGIVLSFHLNKLALQQNCSAYKSKLPATGLGRQRLIVQ